MDSAVMRIAPPTSLAIERVLFDDGLGVVFAGHRTDTKDLLLIKALADAPGGAHDVVGTFARDARIAAHLPTDAFFPSALVRGEDGAPLVLIDHPAEGDLWDRIRRLGAASLNEALTIVEDLARALGLAHRAGLVVGDLDPSSVHIGDRARIVDLGFSRYRPDGAPRLQARVATGLDTPSYLSPEHWLGDALEPATDVWSLAVIALELLMGERAFAGGNVASLRARILGGEAAFPTAIPGSLARVLRAALAADSRARPSVDDIADAFRNAALGRA
jgi:serine/threonine-protein kinase